MCMYVCMYVYIYIYILYNNMLAIRYKQQCAKTMIIAYYDMLLHT